MTQDTGVTPSGSGHSPEGGAASSTASPAKPSVPNADETLWCVHSIGSDDIDAAPDFDTAERWAVESNRMMREYEKSSGMENDPYWPRTRSVVAVWPWDAKSHADALPSGVRAFTPVIIAQAEDKEALAREIEGDSDNPLRVAEVNKLYAEAAELRAQYASAIEARRAATGNTDAVHESAAPKEDAR